MKQKSLKVNGLRLFTLCVMLFLTFLTCNLTQAQTFPSGFSRVQVVSTGATVTNLAFATDGRIFIAHQDGRIRLYKNGVLSTMITLSNVRSGGEDGLSAITLDPNFATNNYMYVCYTTTGLVNRLSRLTLSGDAVVAQLTLRDFPLLSTTSQRHNGGAIRFKDGYLFISIGENDIPSAAQDKNSYGGKVLRLNPDGTPAVGNPYYNDAGANTERKCIWSMGERNPWSMDISPSTGKIYVCNVGQTFAEEINDVTTAGTNSGHPTVEGNSTNPAFKNPVYYVTNPNYTPGTTSEGCAIIGAAFLESATTNYPAAYVGKFFYMDYCNNWINYINPSTGAYTNFGTGVGSASPGANTTTIRLGADGNLYYAQNGTIFKIIYTNTSVPAITNQPASVTIISGQPASFSVNASGATPMTYQWKKNGVNITGATSTTYTIPVVVAADAGSYTVTATNSFGSATSTAATLTVQAYNAPPVATIITPASGLTYYAGQTISFSGSGSDTEDGTLPASAFKWGLFFDHNGDHSHDLATTGLAVGSKTGSFTTLTGNEKDTNVSYRLVLTVTDSNGLTGTASVSIFPQLSTVSFATQPAGLQVTVNGAPQSTPYATPGVEGITFEMGTLQYQTIGGVNYQFDHWEHGGTMTQFFSVPTDNTTYTAVFVPSTALSATLTATKDAYVKDGANAAINYGATDPTKIETKMDATTNSGFNREGYLNFDLTTISGNINNAQIKVYGNLGAAGSIPVGVYSVATTTWAEATINWNNKPAAGATALATTTVDDINGKYYLWDVTSYIQSEKLAGRTAVSFNMKNLAVTTPQTVWSSKEGANPPQIVITYTPAVTTQSPYGGTALAIPGKIEAENYDLGGQGVAYNDGTPGNSGNAYRTDDVDIEATTEGGYNLSYSAAGDWTEYTVNVTANGTYNFEFRIAAIATGKNIHLEVDGVNVSGPVAVPVGTGWQDFKSVYINGIQLTAGQKVMRIVMDTADQNINYVNITSATANTPPAVVNTTVQATVTSGTAVTLSATATDTAPGTVTSVSFYDGTTLIATDTTSPYTYSWTPTVGSHSVTAKATDNGGATTTSSAITITVTTSSSDPFTSSYFHLIDKYTADYMRPTGGTATAFITQYEETTVPTFSSYQWEFIAAPVAGYYYIVNRYTGKAIQPTGGSTVDNTNLSQTTLVASTTNTELQWAIETSDEANYYWIKNRKSGMYIRPAGGTNGTGIEIVQNTINTTYSSFKWSLANPVAKTTTAKSSTSKTASPEEIVSTATIVYPNPASDSITIVTSVDKTATVFINLYNFTGNLILSKEFRDIQGNFEGRVDISNIPSGTYILKIKKGDTVETQKIIKK
jgi:glucose/arabinose dehydrogenase